LRQGEFFNLWVDLKKLALVILRLILLQKL